MAFGTKSGNQAALPDHHIEGDMLLAYAAGTLGQAASVVVAAHLSFCPRCRAAVLAAEAVGGAFLENITPEPLSENTTALAMARLDATEGAPAVTKSTPPSDAPVLPRPVRDCLPRSYSDLDWKWVSPGIKYAEMLTDGEGVRLGLMLAQPAAAITPHGHGGEELTMVLSGGYSDGATRFGPGDVQSVDHDTIHEPLTDDDGECLSLVMTSGRIKPTRLIARIFRHFTPF
jgi:putative transcriptional regulator